jgi:ribonuclease HII
MKIPNPSFDEEKMLWNAGYDSVVGIDEVGRGAFAGPVTVAAVIFTKTAEELPFIPDIHDSKLLLPKKREALSFLIQQHARTFAIATVSVRVINSLGIGKATTVAFRKVLHEVCQSINQSSSFLLVDGFHIKHMRGFGLRRQKAIIKGDQKSVSIAAASIIAKVHRDALMTTYHTKYRAYNFAENKGYGTKEHRDCIKKYGLSKLHRTSFDLTKFLP